VLANQQGFPHGKVAGRSVRVERRGAEGRRVGGSEGRRVEGRGPRGAGDDGEVTFRVETLKNPSEKRMLRSYQDLDVFKRSLKLVSGVYRVTAKLPAEERFGLTSQMRRAAVSVPCNIAEGYGRYSLGEYLNHLSNANGSLFELEALELICEDLSFLTRRDLTEVNDHLIHSRRLLRGLKESLQQKRSTSK
jgi:four helix bundle protein